jgi:hypothetical protein
VPKVIEAERLNPPSRLLLALEWRAFWELGAFFASIPVLRMMPRGDGHSVLVLPGLMADDASTRLLREFLLRSRLLAARLGAGPQLRPARRRRGRNDGEAHGNRRANRAQGKRDRLEPRRPLCACACSAVTGNRSPGHHLGTPFTGDPRASNAWRLYEMTSGLSVDDSHWRDVSEGAARCSGDVDLQPQRRDRHLAMQRGG